MSMFRKLDGSEDNLFRYEVVAAVYVLVVVPVSAFGMESSLPQVRQISKFLFLFALMGAFVSWILGVRADIELKIVAAAKKNLQRGRQ